MAQPQPAHQADEGAASDADGSLHKDEPDSKAADFACNPPPTEPQEYESQAHEPTLTSEQQEDTYGQAGADEVSAGSNQKEYVTAEQESSTVAETTPLLSKHPSKSEETPTVLAEAADDSSVHKGVDLSADDSQDTREDRLPPKPSLSFLRSKQQEERDKGAAENVGSTGAASTRQSNRILQLKAKFEKQNQPAVASSEGAHTAGSSSPAETTGGGGVRRRFGSARHASPTPVHADNAAQGSPSVQLMRSRFEHLKDRPSPSHGELKTSAKSVASRKLAEQTLQQLASVDIAARYGKPYKRKEKMAEPDNNEGSHAASHDSDGLAGSQASDKRTVGGESPAGPMAETKGRDDQVGTEAESSENNTSGGGERGAEAGVRAAGCLDTSEEASAQAHQAIDETQQSNAAESAGKDAEAQSPSATVCGHPSPAIGRLAAIIAGKAQNYGKPVPRRLLTRQESDLP
ncbi:hypothetical protein Emed_000258 [Eimeria media]